MATLASALRYLGKHGARAAVLAGARATGRRVWPERVRCYAAVSHALSGRHGLEIGGPTPLFQPRDLIPIYPIVGGLDNVNFATRTVWEGDLTDAGEFRFDAGSRRGTQFVREARDLAGIEDERYDFVVSSHVVEHLANPLLALKEWLRVIRPGGALLLVVPHREGTFDHRRPVTPLSHLIDDLEAGTSEDDLTHLPEILALHDLSRDPGADPATFEGRCRDNFSNRCLHQHVFDTAAVIRLLDHLKLRIVCVEPRRPYHIVALAEKPVGTEPPDNRAWLDSARSLRGSPFTSDPSPGP